MLKKLLSSLPIFQELEDRDFDNDKARNGSWGVKGDDENIHKLIYAP